MILKEVEIKNIEKTKHGYDVTMKRSQNGYKFFTTPWQNIPRYDKNGDRISPEEFKRNIIDKYSENYFKQNYSCVDGDTYINIFDNLNNMYKKIKISELYKILYE